MGHSLRLRKGSGGLGKLRHAVIENTKRQFFYCTDTVDTIRVPRGQGPKVPGTRKKNTR